MYDGRPQRLRLVAAALAAGAGLLLIYASWGPLRNLFGYRDSPVWDYLLFGGLLLVPGLALLGWAVATLRRSRR